MSDTNVKQLQELILEMTRTGYLHDIDPYIVDDHEKLRTMIDEMVLVIIQCSRNFFLKCVVGSVFDTRSVENTIEDLKALNDGWQPKWLFKSGNETIEGHVF